MKKKIGIDDLIPRLIRASKLSAYPIRKSYPYQNFHYFNTFPDKNFQLQFGHVYIWHVAKHFYGIVLQIGKHPIKTTTNPLLLKSPLFIAVLGEDNISTDLGERFFVDKLTKEEKKYGYDMTLKFMDILLYEKIKFISSPDADIWILAKKYCWYLPSMTAEKQVPSQLPKMLGKIGQELCYGPLILYKEGANNLRQAKAISGYNIIQGEQIDSCNDVYGIVQIFGHFMAFKQTKTVFTFLDSSYEREGAGERLKEVMDIFKVKKKIKIQNFNAQNDGMSCSMFSTFYYQQLRLFGEIKNPWPTFQWVHDMNVQLLKIK